MAPQARRPGAVLLVGAFVVVAVIGAALAGPFELRQRDGVGPVTMPPPELPAEAVTPQPAPTSLVGAQTSMPAQRWIYLVALVILGALLMLGVALLARRLRARWARREPSEVDVAAPDVELGGDVVDSATPASISE